MPRIIFTPANSSDYGFFQQVKQQVRQQRPTALNHNDTFTASEVARTFDLNGDGQFTGEEIYQVISPFVPWEDQKLRFSWCQSVIQTTHPKVTSSDIWFQEFMGVRLATRIDDPKSFPRQEFLDFLHQAPLEGIEAFVHACRDSENFSTLFNKPRDFWSYKNPPSRKIIEAFLGALVDDGQHERLLSVLDLVLFCGAVTPDYCLDLLRPVLNQISDLDQQLHRQWQQTLLPNAKQEYSPDYQKNFVRFYFKALIVMDNHLDKFPYCLDTKLLEEIPNYIEETDFYRGLITHSDPTIARTARLWVLHKPPKSTSKPLFWRRSPFPYYIAGDEVILQQKDPQQTVPKFFSLALSHPWELTDQLTDQFNETMANHYEQWLEEQLSQQFSTPVSLERHGADHLKRNILWFSGDLELAGAAYKINIKVGPSKDWLYISFYNKDYRSQPRILFLYDRFHKNALIDIESQNSSDIFISDSKQAFHGFELLTPPLDYQAVGPRELTEIDQDLAAFIEEHDPGHKRADIAVVMPFDVGVDYNNLELQQRSWRFANLDKPDGQDNDGNGLVDDTMGWDFLAQDNTPYDLELTGMGFNYDLFNLFYGDHLNYLPLSTSSLHQHGTSVTMIMTQSSAYSHPLSISTRSARDRDVWSFPILTKPENIKKYMGYLFTKARAAGMQKVIVELSVDIKYYPVIDYIKSYANNPDVFFVVSAGNYGYGFREGFGEGRDLDQNPTEKVRELAQVENNNLISVAAVDQNGVYYEPSAFGAVSVDFAAWGVDVPTYNVWGSPVYFYATSASAANAADLASLIWSVFPHLTSRELRELMVEMAKEQPVVDNPQDSRPTVSNGYLTREYVINYIKKHYDEIKAR